MDTKETELGPTVGSLIPTFPKALVKLSDLIGELDHLDLQSATMDFKNLSIKYWIYSNTKQLAGTKPPVIAIHGGPSSPHNYMLPLKLLGMEQDEKIRLIFSS